MHYVPIKRYPYYPKLSKPLRLILIFTKNHLLGTPLKDFRVSCVGNLNFYQYKPTTAVMYLVPGSILDNDYPCHKKHSFLKPDLTRLVKITTRFNSSMYQIWVKLTACILMRTSFLNGKGLIISYEFWKCFLPKS